MQRDGNRSEPTTKGKFAKRVLEYPCNGNEGGGVRWANEMEGGTGVPRSIVCVCGSAE